ncbi:GreA/GreB family elongation factor [Alteromonas sp. M12]|uniref:GreA/GreB family elongation factor n=1 Tax=Alteromonas sp. M12 TaxID=3135644 RepID=UPI00319DE19B
MQPNIIISRTDLAAVEHLLERTKLSDDCALAIENELDRAIIVSLNELPKNVVALGCKVSFEILDTQKRFIKTLCLPTETHLFEDPISVLTPIGTALLGLTKGQCIKWQTQKGMRTVQVNKIKHILPDIYGQQRHINGFQTVRADFQ